MIYLLHNKSPFDQLKYHPHPSALASSRKIYMTNNVLFGRLKRKTPRLSRDAGFVSSDQHRSRRRPAGDPRVDAESPAGQADDAYADL
jgi:hypothetical protein